MNTFGRVLLSVSALAAGVSQGQVQGRFVRVDIPRDQATLSLAEVQIFSGGENVARKGKASQCCTAWDGDAARAIDGNTDGDWGKGSITHTEENIENPWWEVDLGAAAPIDKVVLWNRSGYEGRLNHARVLVMDEGRIIRWTGQLNQAKMENPFEVKPGAEDSIVGKHIDKLQPPEIANRRQLAALQLFNPVAMERAIESFAKKHPQAYPNKAALLGELAAVKAATASVTDASRDAAAQKVYDLSLKVYGQHPATKKFSDVLYVRRSNRNIGMPANWQGNSSVPVSGYENDIVRAPLFRKDGAEVKVLYASEHYLGDFNLDFKAEKIAFSTRKASGKGWGIAEMRLDAPGKVTELTPDEADIDYYDPMYLPNGRMFMVGSSGFQGVPCVGGADYVGNLLLRYEDGRIRRLSYDQDNNWYPVMLPNGRCLYLRWEYTETAHYFSRVLMTMNPDGTDQQEYYGSNSYWPNSLFYARPLPGSSTKFIGVVTGHHGVARKGRLYLFDVERGRHEVDGVVQQLPGYGKKVVLLPIDQQRPDTDTEHYVYVRDELANDAKQFFLHPFPLADDLFLVSMQDPAVQNRFMLALVDIYDNQFPIEADGKLNIIEPFPVMKPEQPAPIPDRVDESKTNCTINCVSIYNGPGLAGIPKDKVKKLAVFYYEYSPRNIGGHYTVGIEGPWDPRVMLGTVDVEADGSFMFEAPPNLPISILPLDAEGKSMQMMRSWFVGMPGEVLSCVGCHQQQNYASPNQRTVASRKKAQQIQPWFGPRRGFAFDREVQNVLDRNCVGCHNDETTATNALGQKAPSFTRGNGEWGFGKSYLAFQPYFRRNGPEGDYHLLTPMEFHADTSEMIQMLTKGHHNVKLSEDDWSRLQMWLDLDVPYFGTWTERGAQKRWLERRREFERKYSNNHFDPEVIVNPYQPADFVAPQKAPPPPAPKSPLPMKVDALSGEKEMALDLGNGVKMALARVPSGQFTMGASGETPAELPLCGVRIAKPFWMGATEVTVAQFKAFDPAHDNGVYDMHYKDQVKRGYYMNLQQDTQLPAIRISWEKAMAYCEWLSKKTGKKVTLPTEAQWEWACRAGTETPLSFGGFDTDFAPFANLAGAERKKLAVDGVNPQPMANPPPILDYELRDPRFNDGVLFLAEAGKFKPNAFGLHDMHGNVAEWTRSAFRPYPYVDGDGRNSAKTADEKKVVRGGSWNSRQIRATSTWRWAYPGWMRPFDVGFRVIIED
ncbi:MAG: SUMF1/EgtB/PvdO family nonheme iron enzyme [Kiritimatiellaeota bacterium]|nr:SUMF1/EgtB/PvdO family nonheme iron enzyme [Kiritimatiellota bacterium]